MASLTFIAPIPTASRTNFTTKSFTTRITPLPRALSPTIPHYPLLHPLRMIISPERTSTTPEQSSSSTMSILLPEKLSDEGISLLAENFTICKNLDLTPETLLKEIPNHDAIIIRSGTKMTREVIEAATKLKVIGRAGVGVDNIDIPAATERGVLVVNAPTGNCIAAAEHSIALLCAMSRLISPADNTVKAGGWDRSKFVGASLVDKTLGVIGLGRIGREVSKRAKGLGMKVIARDPIASDEVAAAIGVSLVSFEELLERSDFLTLHIPLMPATRNLIDAAAIAKMKDGARIVNAARGGVIDETALLEALESGKVAGAALDCYAFEPPNKHPDSISAKLVKHPKVLATPHLGASTREAQEDVAVEVATAVRDVLNGDMVATMINAPSMAPEVIKAMKPRAMLCQALGRLAYYLSGKTLHGEVSIDYYIPDASEDTRILRAGLIKGLLEPAMGIPVSIVNADAVAKNAKLNLTEVNHFSVQEASNEVVVQVKNALKIEGRVVNGKPHVTRIGRFYVDLELDGIIIAYSQDDRPGQLGRVGTHFGEEGVNISSMTLARDIHSSKALVMICCDSRPSERLLAKVDEVINDPEMRPLIIEF